MAERTKTALAFIGVLIDDISDMADEALNNDTFYVTGLLIVGVIFGVIIGVEIIR